MAAPKGNEFWRLRSKHGRDKIFKSPDKMLEAAYEYFAWCEQNPLIEIDYRGANPPVKVELPKMRAYTMHGLTMYLDVNTVYFNQFEESIKGKTDEMSIGFSKVITHVKDVIYNQKFVGAASGFLNPNIIARDLGLHDSQKIDHSGEVTQSLIITVDSSETAEALKKLRDGGKVN
jgi:hypothetical protein